jgi:hypothetical protein
VPAATPVTTPDDELTVAADVFELDHVPPLVVLLNVCVKPAHTDNVPDMFGVVGKAYTVKVAVCFASQLLEFFTV